MTALERAESALRVEVERQVQANGSYSGPANGSPNYVDAELDYGLLVRAVLMAVREPDESVNYAGAMVGPDTNAGEFSLFDARNVFEAMIDAILNEKDTTND